MKRVLIATTISLAILTSGCTGTSTNGNANPQPTSGATPTSGSGSTSGLDAVKPCDLLSEGDVTGLGLKYPGESDKDGTSEACDWAVSGNGGLRVGVRPKSGIKDLNLSGDKVSQTKVGKYDTTKVEAPDGAKSNCTYVIAVSESSTVAVIANLTLTSEDTAAACQRASKAAELIAPKLP
jgi:hypothetical protein